MWTTRFSGVPNVSLKAGFESRDSRLIADCGVQESVGAGRTEPERTATEVLMLPHRWRSLNELENELQSMLGFGSDGKETERRFELLERPPFLSGDPQDASMRS